MMHTNPKAANNNLSCVGPSYSKWSHARGTILPFLINDDPKHFVHIKTKILVDNLIPKNS